jgi:hypothetical protein
MSAVRALRASFVALGLGCGPLCLWLGIGLVPVVVSSGCDDTKTTGRQVEMDSVTKKQQREMLDDMREVYKQKQEAQKKGRR